MTLRLSKSQRRERILSELKLAPLVRISDLAGRFGVSTETIRRDVEALSNQGLVERMFGGASARPMGVQPTFGERDRAYVKERERIAECAAAMIQPGEVLMIDAGSTTTQFARHLAAYGKSLTAVTNSYSVAAALSGSDSIRVILCPGDYVHREAGVYGADTLAFLRSYRANKAFLGASGLAADGIMDVNSAASWVKRVMVQQSDQSFVLVDHSKFEAHFLNVVAPLSAIDGVIVDSAPPSPLTQALTDAGVAVHMARQDPRL